MTETGQAPIVVGVDGSEDCVAALHWAAAEAALRGCAVEAVSVSILDRVSGVRSDISPFTVRVAAQLAAAAAEYPSVQLRHIQSVGSPASTLVRHSHGALMLVVGSHGAGAVARALLGSTSAYCARHAECQGDRAQQQATGQDHVVYQGQCGHVRAVAVNTWAKGEIATVVTAVRRSPSADGARPWVLEFHDGSVSLFERLDMRLPWRDPTGRDRLISCGTAFINLRLAVRWLGWDLRWKPFPNPEHPDDVARVTLTGRCAPTAAELAHYQAIGRGRRHHGPFGAPAPEPVVRELALGVTVPGVHLRSLRDSAQTRLIVVTSGDRRYDRLLAGMALEEVWLAATQTGLVASLTTQPFGPPGIDGFPQTGLRLGFPSRVNEPRPYQQRTEVVRAMEEASS